MKIVEIINCLSGRGGAENFVVQLFDELSKNNDVRLIILHDEINEKFKEFYDRNVDRIFICNKKSKISFNAAKKLKNFLNNFQPNIVHCHLSCLPTYFLAFGFKRKKWHIFQTIHNLAEKDAGRINRFLYKIYIKKNILSLVGISNIISQSVCKIYKIDSCFTVYNGIKIVNNYHCSDKKYTFINVARFSEQKNHKLLFDSFLLYWQKHHDSTLLCLGNGELFDYYSDYVSSLECSKNIFLLGAKNDVFPYLCESNVFVMTSKYEGNPISLLEAMSVGLPIIATKVGGIPDVVCDGENGFLCDDFDKNTICDYMEKALQHDIFSKLSLSSLEKIKFFSIENVSEEYIKIFKEYKNK